MSLARAPGGIAVLLLGLAVSAAGVDAQEAWVRSVRMSVDLTRGDAQVLLEYEIDGAQDAETLPATILDFGSARAIDLALGSDGAPGVLESGVGVARSARVVVEEGAREGSRLVVVTYRVTGAVSARGTSLRGHVPVLSVDRSPAGAEPGFFRAELRLPPEWSVTEGFPSGISPTQRAGVYEVALSVVPAVISFRGRSDGAWRPGAPLLLDLLAGVILLAFSAVGLRHLRRVAA